MHAPTLGDVRDAVLAIREGKGLLIREGFESFKSAGSFFKNPVVTAEEYERIARIVEEAGGFANWAWPMESGTVKISAACLIQCAGFHRGQRKGAAGISPRHTLIMVNYGGASAREIIDFAAEVRQRVFECFGVFLVPEVRLIGFDGTPLGEMPGELEGVPGYSLLQTTLWPDRILSMNVTIQVDRLKAEGLQETTEMIKAEKLTSNLTGMKGIQGITYN